jgi:hypothetical protein
MNAVRSQYVVKSDPTSLLSWHVRDPVSEPPGCNHSLSHVLTSAGMVETLQPW